MAVYERVRLENEKGGGFCACVFVCESAYSEPFPRILMNRNALLSFRTKRPGDLNFSILMYQNTFDILAIFLSNTGLRRLDCKRFYFLL